MALKLSHELTQMDNAIRAANRKLTTYAKQFGKQSVQYGNLEAMVIATFTDTGMLRTNAAGVKQIARTAKSVRLIALSETQTHMIKKINRQKTVREIKAGILQDWAERSTSLMVNAETGEPATPGDILADMTAAEKRDVVAKELHFYDSLRAAIDECLDKIYDRHRAHSRAEYDIVEKMRRESKGRWTSRDTLTSWLDQLTSSLGATGQRIKNRFYEQVGI